MMLPALMIAPSAIELFEEISALGWMMVAKGNPLAAMVSMNDFRCVVPKAQINRGRGSNLDASFRLKTGRPRSCFRFFISGRSSRKPIKLNFPVSSAN
jgi:hypothetical protein